MTARPASSRSTLPAVAILVSLLSQNMGAAIAKSLFPLVGIAGMVSLRVGLSAVLLAAIFRPWRAPPPRAMIPYLAGYGIALGAMNLLIYKSFARIPLGIAVAVEVTGPLAIVLIYSRHRRDLIWAAIACVGLALLVPVQADGATLDLVGLGLAFGAALCWALYIVLGKRVSALPGGSPAAWGLIAASVAIVPIGVADAGSRLATPTALLFGLGVAALSSAIPYSLEIVALRRLPRSVFGMLVSAAPAVSALVGYAALGERLTLLQWTAILCIIAASLGSAAGARRAGVPEPAPLS